jgi:hypothetical protein
VLLPIASDALLLLLTVLFSLHASAATAAHLTNRALLLLLLQYRSLAL